MASPLLSSFFFILNCRFTWNQCRPDVAVNRPINSPIANVSPSFIIPDVNCCGIVAVLFQPAGDTAVVHQFISIIGGGGGGLANHGQLGSYNISIEAVMDTM